MNINELNRIKTVNIEEAVAGVERGTGTFKEILDNVMNGVIIPLVDNSGRIVGINFSTNVTNIIEDCIEQRKFEIRYCCKPVMDWALAALTIKADGKAVAEVIENAEEGIKVITTAGETITISEPRRVAESHHAAAEELPEEVDIDMDEIEPEDSSCQALVKAVKKHLRNTYEHYLSGFAGDPEIEEDEEEGVYHVSNIHWGRKI